MFKSIEEWAKYGNFVYSQTWEKLRRVSPQETEIARASWHRSCTQKVLFRLPSASQKRHKLKLPNSIDDGNCNDNATNLAFYGSSEEKRACSRHLSTNQCRPLWKIKVATFTVLLTAWTHNRNSLIHCIWFNGAQTNPVVAYIANIIACKYSQLDRCLLLSDVFLAVVVIIAKASYCDC